MKSKRLQAATEKRKSLAAIAKEHARNLKAAQKALDRAEAAFARAEFALANAEAKELDEFDRAERSGMWDELERTLPRLKR